MTRTLPRPTATMSVMSELLAVALDTAERLETQIAEAASELAECNQDWRAGILQIRLTSARNEQARQVASAAQALRTIEELRERSGMGASVLARIYEGYAR